MKATAFPSCCAITLLQQFGSTITAFEPYPIPNSDIKQYLEKFRHTGKIITLTLNSEQLNKIGRDLFIDLGYTITELGYFPGHGNDIFLLHYNDNKRV